MEEKKYCIYKHTNKINGKVYIGQTGQEVKARWKGGSGYNKCSYFWKAIKKYGWNNFKHEILFNDLTLKEANVIEEFCIAYYKSNDPDYGYNLRSGGLNYAPNEMARLHLSEALKKCNRNLKKENNPMWGRKHSLEAKEKMSKAKQSVFGESNSFYGKHHTEETKRKLSINKGIPVRCVETGVVYHSATEAEKLTVANRKGIANCCKGKQESCAGYHWEYYIKED